MSLLNQPFHLEIVGKGYLIFYVLCVFTLTSQSLLHKYPRRKKDQTIVACQDLTLLISRALGRFVTKVTAVLLLSVDIRPDLLTSVDPGHRL